MKDGTPVISTQGISKCFDTTTALDDISIQVNQGEVYGFIGVNGAGKTTLIRILLGMIKPGSGTVKLFDTPLTSNFRKWNDVGYLVETPHAYPNLSVKENLDVYYRLRQLNDRKLISDIIKKLKLGQYAGKKAKHLSLGNQQRLGLAKALMHRPRLLILDEPVNGLDPEGIVEVRMLLQELAHSGTAVFLSSHILGEVSRIADRIAIIHQGKLIKELTAAELSRQLIKKILVRTADNTKALTLLRDAKYQAALNESDEIEITGDEAVSHPEHITTWLVENGLPPGQIYLFTEDLEQYFLRTIRKRGK